MVWALPFQANTRVNLHTNPTLLTYSRVTVGTNFIVFGMMQPAFVPSLQDQAASALTLMVPVLSVEEIRSQQTEDWPTTCDCCCWAMTTQYSQQMPKISFYENISLQWSTYKYPFFWYPLLLHRPQARELFECLLRQDPIHLQIHPA